MWKAERALVQSEGRPTDLSSDQIAERLAACQTCKHRMGGQCRPARALITVHVLRQQNCCPAGKWPASAQRQVEVRPKAMPAFVYPEAELRFINRLAAVTCHYNPCGYKLIEDNYHRFVRALPVGTRIVDGRTGLWRRSFPSAGWSANASRARRLAARALAKGAVAQSGNRCIAVGRGCRGLARRRFDLVQPRLG